MRKLLFIFLIAASSTLNCLSQDVIYKKDGSEIKAKIIEIEVENVKYKIFEQQDGPVRNIAKKDIFIIIYQDGTKEKFADVAVPNPSQNSSNQNTAVQNNNLNQPNNQKNINQTEIDYVSLKLEQMHSLKNASYIGFCVGLGVATYGLISNNDLSLTLITTGGAVALIAVPLTIYAGNRINYFEKRKWELTLNLIPYKDLYRIKPNVTSNVTIGLRISF